MKYKIFSTRRLILRPTSIEDAPFICELLNTPKWKQFIGDRHVNSIEDAAAYIEKKMIPQLKELGYSNYTMIRKEDEVKLGTCGLYNRPELEGVDIGFALLPRYEKQGYALEAAMKLKDAAFNTFGLQALGGITTKDNASSQKLLEKLGMKIKGPVRLDDDQEELLMYITEK